MAPRTKPKHDSLVWAFVVTVTLMSATWFVMHRFISPPGRPGFPPPPPPNWAGIIPAIVLVGGMSVGYTWLLNRHRARTFRPPGSCKQCGYDRTGLDPGAPCPECGEASSPAT